MYTGTAILRSVCLFGCIYIYIRVYRYIYRIINCVCVLFGNISTGTAIYIYIYIYMAQTAVYIDIDIQKYTRFLKEAQFASLGPCVLYISFFLCIPVYIYIFSQVNSPLLLLFSSPPPTLYQHYTHTHNNAILKLFISNECVFPILQNSQKKNAMNQKKKQETFKIYK